MLELEKGWSAKRAVMSHLKFFKNFFGIMRKIFLAYTIYKIFAKSKQNKLG